MRLLGGVDLLECIVRLLDCPCWRDADSVAHTGWRTCFEALLACMLGLLSVANQVTLRLQ